MSKYMHLYSRQLLEKPELTRLLPPLLEEYGVKVGATKSGACAIVGFKTREDAQAFRQKLYGQTRQGISPSTPDGGMEMTYMHAYSVREISEGHRLTTLHNLALEFNAGITYSRDLTAFQVGGFAESAQTEEFSQRFKEKTGIVPITENGTFEPS